VASEMIAEEKAPRLKAYLTKRGELRVPCPYCQIDHWHGLPYGHRAAHCSKPGSPYVESGYVLVPAEDQPRPAAASAQESAGQSVGPPLLTGCPSTKKWGQDGTNT
jgi:hypothetical protein